MCAFAFDAQTITDAMVYAVSQNQVSVVRKRLESGTQDVNAHDSDGQSALRVAARNDNVYILDMLVMNGANVADASPRDGNTALHLAAIWGREEAARYLLDHGAPVGALNQDSESPLHLAAKMGHVSVLRTLLEKNPDPYVMDYRGRTPAVVAEGCHISACSTVLREYQEGRYRKHVHAMLWEAAALEDTYLESLPESLLAEILFALTGQDLSSDLSGLLETPTGPVSESSTRHEKEQLFEEEPEASVTRRE